MENLEMRIDRLEHKADKLEERMYSLERQVSTLETKVDYLLEYNKQKARQQDAEIREIQRLLEKKRNIDMSDVTLGFVMVMGGSLMLMTLGMTVSVVIRSITGG